MTGCLELEEQQLFSSNLNYFYFYTHIYIFKYFLPSRIFVPVLNFFRDEMDSRLLKFSIFAEDIKVQSTSLIYPRLGFKLLGFPLIELDLYKDKQKQQYNFDLALKGVSPANLENTEGSCRFYHFFHGKSVLFLHNLDALKSRAVSIPLYERDVL